MITRRIRTDICGRSVYRNGRNKSHEINCENVFWIDKYGDKVVLYCVCSWGMLTFVISLTYHVKSIKQDLDVAWVNFDFRNTHVSKDSAINNWRTVNMQIITYWKRKMLSVLGDPIVLMTSVCQKRKRVKMRENLWQVLLEICEKRQPLLSAKISSHKRLLMQWMKRKSYLCLRIFF